jgi:hypothetical protein
LVLDDDELPNGSLLKDLDNLTNGSADAYLIPRRNYYSKEEYYQHIHYPDYQLRLFKKSHAKVSEKIHSRPEIRGVVEALPDKYYLVHNDAIYSNLEKYRGYARIQANETVPVHHYLLYVGYTGVAFLNSFVGSLLTKCYLDGLPGLCAAYRVAYYEMYLNVCKAVVKYKFSRGRKD